MIKIPKTRARLDIEGLKVTADKMSPEQYHKYCNRKWYSQEEIIDAFKYIDADFQRVGFDDELQEGNYNLVKEILGVLK